MSSVWKFAKLIVPGTAVGYFAGRCVQMLPLRWQGYVSGALAALAVSYAVTGWLQHRDLYLRFLNLQAELRMRYREEFERFERESRR